jgi:hypothetical protein
MRILNRIAEWLYAKGYRRHYGLHCSAFPCLRCNKRAYTIGGQCNRCAYDLHRKNYDTAKELRDIEAKFTAKTGKTALQDWYAWEAFLYEYKAGQ